MTLKQALCQATALLASCGIDQAHQESDLLLRCALEAGALVQLYTDLEQELPPETASQFWHLVERRRNHEPIAYILGHCNFFNIDFFVDPRVLIPRSGSELLVEEALKFLTRRSLGRQRPCLIADVGTGAGAIAVTLALYLPRAKIYATDISSDALEVAAKNCQRHGVGNRVRLLLGDMLKPLPEPVDLIVANLPYIKNSEIKGLSAEIRMFEPIVSLAGGEDGLDKVRHMMPQAVSKLRRRGLILMELGEGQGLTVTSLAKHYFPRAKVELVPDPIGTKRVLRILNH